MNKEWHINIKDIGLIRVSYRLIEKLKGYRQISDYMPESGGVLIGTHLNSNGILLIDELTPPQPSDEQGRYLFFRSKEHHTLVKSIWEKSNHYSTYIGLWHTHAEPIPNFSSADRKDWIDALNKSQYDGDILFFFIVGQTHIRCWMGTKKFFKNKLELVGEYCANME